MKRGVLIYVMISCLVVFEKRECKYLEVRDLKFDTQHLTQNLVQSRHTLIFLLHNVSLVNMSSVLSGSRQLRIKLKSNFLKLSKILR